jgi:hypothetical protein
MSPERTGLVKLSSPDHRGWEILTYRRSIPNLVQESEPVSSNPIPTHADLVPDVLVCQTVQPVPWAISVGVILGNGGHII